MTRAPLARCVAVATLVVAAACVLAPPVAAAATASPCGSGSGVTVIVDPGALGGAVTTACDSGSEQTASARYGDVGIALTYVQRSPGFVCRVDGAPASDLCVNTPPADAYWGLWWTDGSGGTWTYSSIGAAGLQVPEGGAVAFAWQQGSTRREPGIAAPVRTAPSPTVTKSPTTKPTAKPTPTPPSPTASASSASPSPTPSPTPSTAASTSAVTPGAPTSSPTQAARTRSSTRSPDNETKTPQSSASPTTEPTTTPSETPSETSTPSTPSTPVSGEPVAAEPESGRVPTWLTLTILGLLLVAIGTSTVAARRRTRH